MRGTGGTEINHVHVACATRSLLVYMQTYYTLYLVHTRMIGSMKNSHTGLVRLLQ